MKRIWILLMFLSAAGGAYFLVVAGNDVISYVAEPGNAYRHEYIQGAAIFFILSAPFWFAVAAFAYPLRKTVSRRVYIALNVPGVLMALVIVFTTVAPILYSALSST